MSKYFLLVIYILLFLLLLNIPIAQSASSDEEKYDERRDIGQKSEQYPDPTKKTNPPEIMRKTPSTANPNSQNEGGASSPSSENQDSPIGGTGRPK